MVIETQSPLSFNESVYHRSNIINVMQVKTLVRGAAGGQFVYSHHVLSISQVLLYV